MHYVIQTGNKQSGLVGTTTSSNPAASAILKLELTSIAIQCLATTNMISFNTCMQTGNLYLKDATLAFASMLQQYPSF